jgi:peptidoglycan/xylan/chitin deacetylase (PgdA/CDA1 family)
MKRLALRLMRNCGAFAVARTMSAGLARILMYHNFQGPGESNAGAVNTTELRGQLTYLRRHFQVVPLASIVEHLKTGQALNDRTVALTVDDGRRNFYQFFFPVLKEFAMPATFFVVSSFIRSEDWLWTDKVLWLSEQAPRELPSSQLDALFSQLNQLRPDARNLQISELAATMKVSIPRDPPSKYAPCSWMELREMADSGLVEIGSHTVTHPILASLTEEESGRELTLSRSQLEQGMGRPVRSFCIPNGKAEDYRPSHLRQIADAGYSGAVVAFPGMVSREANPYELPRLGVSGDSDELAFSKNLDGAEYYQAKLLRAFHLRSPQPGTTKPSRPV